MKKKCIIICNGPTVENITKTRLNPQNYDLIAVNRWHSIFEKLSLPEPNVVIIGKNSYGDNYESIKTMNNTQFLGTEPMKMKNYKQLFFGVKNGIEYPTALWWSGIYAIQYALQQKYDEIHVFGFTCTDEKDYKDTMKRAPIPQPHFVKVVKYFQYLKNKNMLKNVYFYEDPMKHPIFSNLR